MVVLLRQSSRMQMVILFLSTNTGPLWLTTSSLFRVKYWCVGKKVEQHLFFVREMESFFNLCSVESVLTHCIWFPQWLIGVQQLSFQTFTVKALSLRLHWFSAVLVISNLDYCNSHLEVRVFCRHNYIYWLFLLIHSVHMTSIACICPPSFSSGQRGSCAVQIVRAPWGKLWFVIMGYINKTDMTWLEVWPQTSAANPECCCPSSFPTPLCLPTAASSSSKLWCWSTGHVKGPAPPYLQALVKATTPARPQHSSASECLAVPSLRACGHCRVAAHLLLQVRNHIFRPHLNNPC